MDRTHKWQQFRDNAIWYDGIEQIRFTVSALQDCLHADGITK